MKNKCFYIIIIFLIPLVSLKAQYYQQIKYNLELICDGEKMILPEGSYLKPLKLVEDGDWKHLEVLIVDSAGRSIWENPCKVSQKTYNIAASDEIDKEIKILNHLNQEIKVEAGKKFIVLPEKKSQDEKKWDFYNVLMVDEEGNVLKTDGNPLKEKEKIEKNSFKVSKIYYDKATMDVLVKKLLAQFQSTMESSPKIQEPCQNDKKETLKEPKTLKPKAGLKPKHQKPIQKHISKPCRVLHGKMTNKSKTELKACLNHLKREIVKASPGLNREKIFKKMLSLSKEEQDFLALTLTVQGEAGILAPPLSEMMIIMKVLENRIRYARQKGHKNVTTLHAALQPSQFSMYNEDDKGWKMALVGTNNKEHIENSIDAFIKHKNSSKKTYVADYGKVDIDDVYHYVANYAKTRKDSWWYGQKEVKITVNGLPVDGKKFNQQKDKTRHKFYANIRWTFWDPASSYK